MVTTAVELWCDSQIGLIGCEIILPSGDYLYAVKTLRLW